MKDMPQYLMLMLFCLGPSVPGQARSIQSMTMSQVKNSYSNVRVVQVSTQDYEALYHQAKSNHFEPIMLARADAPVARQLPAHIPSVNCDSLFKIDTLKLLPKGCFVGDSTKETKGSPSVLNEKALVSPEEVEQDVVSEGYVNTFGQFITDMGKGGGGNDEEWAIVIMVVIGTVAVAGFILLGGKILYDMIVNKKKFPIWRDFSLIYTYSSHRVSGPAGPNHTEDVHFLSTRFALGWQRPVTGVGVGVEAGYLDINVKQSSDARDVFDINGYYILFGPVLRFGQLNPVALKLSFYNGTANRSSIGLISKSRADLQCRISGPFYLGGHFGALYTDIDYSDGFLLKNWTLNNDFTLIYGFHFGYAF